MGEIHTLAPFILHVREENETLVLELQMLLDLQWDYTPIIPS